MSDSKAVTFDSDNPEWTEEDFARSRPASEYPELLDAMARQRSRGAQKVATKTPVSIRLDSDLVTALRASGRGWQARVNAILRKAVL